MIILLIKTIKEFNLINKADFVDEKAYENEISNIAYSIKLLPPKLNRVTGERYYWNICLIHMIQNYGTSS